MSAHVLLNLLNELGSRDKMQGLQRDSVYVRFDLSFDIKITLENLISAVKTLYFYHCVHSVVMDVITFP